VRQRLALCSFSPCKLKFSDLRDQIRSFSPSRTACLSRPGPIFGLEPSECGDGFLGDALERCILSLSTVESSPCHHHNISGHAFVSLLVRQRICVGIVYWHDGGTSFSQDNDDPASPALINNRPNSRCALFVRIRSDNLATVISRDGFEIHDPSSAFLSRFLIGYHLQRGFCVNVYSRKCGAQLESKCGGIHPTCPVNPSRFSFIGSSSKT